MKLPSKLTPYKKSLIPYFVIILDLLTQNSMTPAELYEKVKKKKLKNLTEFCDALDCLFVLGKIELKEGVLIYVGRN